ncbi:PREDICTED: periodic tryptophan protein 1 homolog [Dinoponera quadriceps]|uniref:Periodic tryptophan protein 1 homolog n=1 Tax=Dinoponera quadriceps TaxID=609295 RepID=A0A6P3X4A9_DINQU|nr:PREDICTED: periodic tryptophan protein 1 homolog [Dinoponera quadriceps]XP_014473135.1 PREDICTED: periodic tryptophan protein 1 homolog [Dinoponera quadriceps]
MEDIQCPSVLVCSTIWVKRGVAAANPQEILLKPADFENIIEQAQADIETDDSDEEVDSSKKESDTLREYSLSNGDEYNFNNYDNESGDVHCHIGNIASFDVDGRDPLVTNDDDDSDKEDDIIKSDDNLLLIALANKDVATLEVHVYNEAEGSFYCHHDIPISSYPVCMEWLSYDPEDPKPGNLCAIGNMSPIIEVWDLDMLNSVEPIFKLGRKPKKKKGQKRVGHKDGVLSLAWNQNYTHVLASGSVDKTVLLWDLENCKPVTKLDSFSEEVASLKWHPQETHRLLTGCLDKTVRLFDCKEKTIVRKWEVPTAVEKVLWNQYDTNYCIASLTKGFITYFDVRANKSVWEIKAHDEGDVSCLALSASCPGLLVSSSDDGLMKVWDIIDHEPTLVWQQEIPSVVVCIAANPDNGFLFGICRTKARSEKSAEVLDFSMIPDVRNRFADRVALHSSATGIKQSEATKVAEKMEDMEIDE